MVAFFQVHIQFSIDKFVFEGVVATVTIAFIMVGDINTLGNIYSKYIFNLIKIVICKVGK